MKHSKARYMQKKTMRTKMGFIFVNLAIFAKFLHTIFPKTVGQLNSIIKLLTQIIPIKMRGKIEIVVRNNKGSGQHKQIHSQGNIHFATTYQKGMVRFWN